MAALANPNLDCELWEWKDGRLREKERGLSVQDCTRRPLEQYTGFEVYFLPRVEVLESHRDLCEILSQRFFIPKLFWTRTGWDSNGFFFEQSMSVNQNLHYTYFRFLIKEIVRYEGPDEDPVYDWQYAAFVTLWFNPEGRSETTQILLCFDLSNEMKERIRDCFRAPAFVLRLLTSCPFFIHDRIIERIVTSFDVALWGFRTPVRDIEKARFMKNARERYLGMHELSRHIIHEKETLEVGARILDSIAKAHEEYCGTLSKGANRITNHYNEVQTKLLFYELMLDNLAIRAKSFEQRLDNEIRLAFNLASAEDNKELTQMVAILTLIFLPGTFFSGFFGMNFFALDTSVSPPAFRASPLAWIFAAVAVPITILAFLVYYKVQVRVPGGGRIRNAFQSLLRSSRDP